MSCIKFLQSIILLTLCYSFFGVVFRVVMTVTRKDSSNSTFYDHIAARTLVSRHWSEVRFPFAVFAVGAAIFARYIGYWMGVHHRETE